MILDEEIHRSIFLAIVDVPPRTLRDEENTDDLDHRRESLQEGRDTPRPGVGNSEGTVGGPSGDDGTEVPGRVVQRSEGSTVGREGQLGDQEGRGGTGESQTESDKAISAKETLERRVGRGEIPQNRMRTLELCDEWEGYRSICLSQEKHANRCRNVPDKHSNVLSGSLDGDTSEHDCRGCPH